MAQPAQPSSATQPCQPWVASAAMAQFDPLENWIWKYEVHKYSTGVFCFISVLAVLANRGGRDGVREKKNWIKWELPSGLFSSLGLSCRLPTSLRNTQLAFRERERERFSERIGRVSACLRLREREKERKKSISEISDLNSGESESITWMHFRHWCYS